MKTLKTFGELARAFGKSVERMPETFEFASEIGAKLVQKAAKHKIGEYQDAVGPFPEWEELADSTEMQKARAGYPVDSPLLRTGEMRDSISYHASPAGFEVGSPSEIAVYQEFGTATIPPRPFLGPALFENAPAVVEALGKSIEANLAGKVKVTK